MKRFTVLLLVLSLFVTSASALGNSTPVQPAPAPAADPGAPFDLDAAFEAGSVALIETDTAGIEISADAVELPEAMWGALGIEKPADPAAYIADLLAASEPVPVSLSPAGNSGLFDLGGTPFAWYDGVFRPLYPDESRGVEDQYGNLARFSMLGPLRMIGEEGVVYSHDGRYAFFSNCRAGLDSAKSYIDPILIDLSTGEAFLPATYDSSPVAAGGSFVTTACFSADDRFFCYALYGSGHSMAQYDPSEILPYRTAVYRYDMETRSVSRLACANDMNYYPDLCETAGGMFIILRDAGARNPYSGITMFKPAAGGWFSEEKSFDLDQSVWSARSLLCSPASGYAVVWGTSRLTKGSCVLKCFRPDEGFAGMDTYYFIHPDGSITGVTADGFMDMLKDAENGAEPACLDISRIRLSPDGRYALVFGGNKAGSSLLLIRLEDMAAVPVTGAEPVTAAVSLRRYHYHPVIEWNNGNLIIATDTGIRTFRMAAPAQ